MSNRGTKSYRWLKKIGYALLVLGLFIMGWFTYLYWLMIDTWNHHKYTEADVVIVLGAAVWSGHPSPALRERLDASREIFEQGEVKAIITTGGMGTAPPAESVVMKAYLVQKGIPEHQIWIEDESTSTLENLYHAKRIMDEQGWTSALIVTHGYHLHRAVDMAVEVGINAKGHSVETQVLYLPFHMGRELLALTYWEATSLFP